MIWDLARDPGPDALHVTVRGYQWWWGFEYTDADMTVAMGPAEQIIDRRRPGGPGGTRRSELTLEAEGGGARDANGEPDFAGDPLVLDPRALRQAGRRAGPQNHIAAARPASRAPTGGSAPSSAGCSTADDARASWSLDRRRWEGVGREPAARRRPCPTDELAARGHGHVHERRGRAAEGAVHRMPRGRRDPRARRPAPDLTHFADPTHECFAGCNWETSRTWTRSRRGSATRTP